MEAKVLLQDGNHLQVRFTIQQKSDEKFLSLNSHKYLCGTVAVQFQVESARCCKYNENNYMDGNITVLARFVKALKDDNLTYECKLTSDVLKVKNMTFFQEEIWHKIYHHNIPTLRSDAVVSYTFDISFTYDLAPTVGPFESLYEDTNLADFELNGEGGSVAFHRVILAASSPVLMTMLCGDWKETSQGSVSIDNVTKETLQQFKDYIYLHKLPDSNIEQLLPLGSYYMMPDLVQKCIVKLLHMLNPENVLDLIEYAVKHKVSKLLLSILNNIQEGILNIKSITEDSLINMLEGDTLK